MRKILLTFAMVSSVALSTALAQSRTVSGTVRDNKGEVLTGATIEVKGTTIGVAADENGNFTIDVPEDKAVLVISYYGTESKEIRLDGSSSYQVVLVEEKGKDELEGVQVYGQKIDRRSYTGALNTVSSKEIAQRPVTSVGAALDGAAPGLLVTSGGGQPGSNPDIMLRGQGSLSASSSPLIVLDGAPYSGSLNSINPLDIKDIVVLKDATAKAVYGARAANGVILINTKRGEKGDKPRISFDASVGLLNRFIKPYKTLGTRDYYEKAYEGLLNGSTSGSVGSEEAVFSLGGYNAYRVPNSQLFNTDKSSPDFGKVIPGDDQLIWTDNWMNELQRIGVRQNYNLSVQNGNDNSDYYLSIGYTRDQGIVKNSDYHRITGLLNVNSKVTSWLNAGFKMQATYDDQLFFLGSGNAFSNPFMSAQMMGAIYPVYMYNEDGSRMKNADGTDKYDFGNNMAGDTWNNTRQVRPYDRGLRTNTVASLTYDKPNTIAINGNTVGFVEAKIYRDLIAKSTISLNYYNGNSLNYYNAIFGDAANVNGRGQRSTSTNINFTFNQFLTWRPQAANLNRDSADHTFALTAGHENYNLKNSSLSAGRAGYAISARGYEELDAAAVPEFSSSVINRLRIETYFAQAEYNFKRKYYISGSYSRNGSSRFSPEARWGNFGSAGVGWVFSDENFMKEFSKKHLEYAKLRFSWGVSGNDALGGTAAEAFYPWMDRFNITSNDQNSALTFLRWGNPILRWEGAVDMNLGIDVVTKANRLSVSLDAYNRGSNNLLYIFPLATSTGSTGYYANVGSMRNRGLEASISYDVLRPKTVSGISWNSKMNLAFNRNAITQMQGSEDTLFGSGTIMTKGEAINTFWLPEYAGVNEFGQPTWYAASTGERTADYDALSQRRDYKAFGSSFRDLEGSWSNTFRYKNVDVNFTFTFGLGGKYYDGLYAQLVSGASSALGNAMHVDLLNSWKEAGDELKEGVLPKHTYGYAGRFNSASSSRFLISNSFLRMRNLNIGYNFPTKMLNRSSISNARIYVASDNLFNVSARQGVDLQSSFFGSSDFTYFPMRTVVFGVNLSL